MRLAASTIGSFVCCLGLTFAQVDSSLPSCGVSVLRITYRLSNSFLYAIRVGRQKQVDNGGQHHDCSIIRRQWPRPLATLTVHFVLLERSWLTYLRVPANLRPKCHRGGDIFRRMPQPQQATLSLCLRKLSAKRPGMFRNNMHTILRSGRGKFVGRRLLQRYRNPLYYEDWPSYTS